MDPNERRAFLKQGASAAAVLAIGGGAAFAGAPKKPMPGASLAKPS